MPSHVLAILIRTRSRHTPFVSYSEISLRALAIVAAVSKLRLAATSVETRPGTTLRISQPNRTNSRSMNSSAISSWLHRCSPPARLPVHKMAVRGHLGGVIEKRWVRCGVLRTVLAIASMSPVSATTVVYFFKRFS